MYTSEMSTAKSYERFYIFLLKKINFDIYV